MSVARLRSRYERRGELHLAFMLLGSAVVCQRAGNGRPGFWIPLRGRVPRCQFLTSCPHTVSDRLKSRTEAFEVDALVRRFA